MNDLEKLSRTKLKIPKGIRKFIWEKTDFQTNKTVRVARYVEVIEQWHGKLIQRVFAYKSATKKLRYKDIMIEEVARTLEGYNNKQLIGNIDCGMWGKTVYFEGFSRMYINSSRWTFYVYRMTDERQLINDLDIKYCQYFEARESHNLYMSFFDYICAYRAQPKIELLVKAGLTQYVRVYKKLDMNAKTLEKIFRVPAYWKQHIKDLSYGDIVLIKNKRYKIKNLEELNLIKKFISDNSSYKKIVRYASLKMKKYVDKMSYNDKHIYNDYLNFCEILKLDMSNKQILFPKDLKKAHDDADKMITVKNNKDTDEKIFEAYTELLPFVYSQNNYVIVPAESFEDLQKESRELEHCVRQYADRYGDRKTNIMFVRDVGDVTKPLVTLEFAGKRVVQVRAAHNALPPESVSNFVRQWEAEYGLTGY